MKSTSARGSIDVSIKRSRNLLGKYLVSNSTNDSLTLTLATSTALVQVLLFQLKTLKLKFKKSPRHRSRAGSKLQVETAALRDTLLRRSAPTHKTEIFKTTERSNEP